MYRDSHEVLLIRIVSVSVDTARPEGAQRSQKVITERIDSPSCIRTSLRPRAPPNAVPCVPENHREQALRIAAGTGEFDRVAHAARADLDEHFAGLRAVEIDRHDFELLSGGLQTPIVISHAVFCL